MSGHRKAALAILLLVFVAALSFYTFHAGSARHARESGSRARSEHASDRNLGDRAPVERAALAGLETRIARLERRDRPDPAREERPSDANVAGERAFPEPQDPEEARAQEQEEMAVRRALLEAQMRSEAVDRRWAAEAEDSIRSAFDGGELAGSTPTQLECRSTLCRLEVAHESSTDADKLMAELPVLVPSLPVTRIQRVADGRLIAFFGRDHDSIRRVLRQGGP